MGGRVGELGVTASIVIWAGMALFFVWTLDNFSKLRAPPLDPQLHEETISKNGFDSAVPYRKACRRPGCTKTKDFTRQSRTAGFRNAFAVALIMSLSGWMVFALADRLQGRGS